MDKNDVKISQLYEELLHNIEEIFRDDEPEILMEQTDPLMFQRILKNLEFAVKKIGPAFDALIESLRGVKYIITEPMAHKLRIVASFFYKLAVLTNSKELRKVGEKFSSWAESKLAKYHLKVAKRFVKRQEVMWGAPPPQVVSFIDRVYNIAKKGLELISKHKIVIGAAGVSAAAATAGVLIYKKYLSAAAKSCKSKIGDEKQKCLIQFRITGHKAEIASLRSSISKCSNASDPMTCRKKIEDRIKNIQDRIKGLEGKK